MNRRDMMALTGAAALAAAASNGGAPQAAETATIGARLLRLYSDAEGQSHMEEIVMAGASKPIPATEIRLATAAAGESSGEFHNSLFRRFVRNLSGEMEITTSDGKTHRTGPGDLVFLEDIAGKGHVSVPVSAITALFIHVRDGFDVVAWAKNAG